MEEAPTTRDKKSNGAEESVYLAMRQPGTTGRLATTEFAEVVRAPVVYGLFRRKRKGEASCKTRTLRI